MENKKQTLIVDGDIVNFTIGRVTEDISDFGDQICESFDKEAMVRLLEKSLDDIGELCGYAREDIIFSISCDKNFRKRKYDTYKSNRSHIKKPLGLKWLREYQKENAEKYQLMMIEELEADDCMGIAATADDTISIYSQDKDLRTIPSRQWDFKKKEFIKPTELEANRWLYTQVLTGDAVDGYKGCPRIGKVKAERALMDCENELELLRETFVRYYVAYKNSIDDAKENLLAQMGQARILNYPDLITLKNFDKTFNPIEIMSVSDEVLQEWADEYTEKISKEKKCKNSSAKNVPKSVKS